MLFPNANRWLPAVLLVVIGATATALPAWSQHGGGHGGGHYSGGHGSGNHYGGFGSGGHGFGGHMSGGHGLGGFSHTLGHGVSNHYYPSYHGGHMGVGYGAYGYNSWPYSYTPRVYSYSGTSPVYVAPPPEPPHSHGPTSDATAAGLSDERAAEAAFRSHHYDDAIASARRAAKERPRDGRLFLLLSQAHLAVGEYRDAAGAARLGMSLLPQEDWGYVVMNFRNYYHDADYVAQVRRLRQFIAENPDHADSRFVLGYHLVFLGYSESANREAYFAAADRELSKAAELNPRDEWANRLLELVGSPQSNSSPSGSLPPVPGDLSLGEPPAMRESPPSVDASVEYPPPQNFEKPQTSGGEGADGHGHKH